MKKRIIAGVVIVGTGAGILLSNAFLKHKENDIVVINDENREMNKLLNSVKKIFDMKPDLVVTSETICKFGGNCEHGTDERFTKMGFNQISNYEDFEKFLSKLKKKKLLGKTIIPIKRTVVMLKYAIKTGTYPNTNGVMDAELFNQI